MVPSVPSESLDTAAHGPTSTAMDIHSEYKLSLEDVAEREISGVTLLVPISSRANSAGIFELNPMASRMWEAFKAHDRVAAVRDQLVAELEADGDEREADGESIVEFTPEVFTEDLVAVANKLAEIGAIQEVESN